MSSGLAAFERFWQRVRQRNDELRPRVAEWLRQLIPTKVGNVPMQVQATALARQDGWRCQVTWLMPPRGRRAPRSSPYHEFPIAPTVPEALSEEDVRMLGLLPHQMPFVPMAWLLEVMAEGWVEAGLAAPPFGLVLGNSVFRGLGQRFRWTDLLRASAYRVTAPLPASIPVLPDKEVDLVAPPGPVTLAETPAALRDACIAGEPGAVRAWGEALAETGDQTSAGLLRWLDRFPAAISQRMAVWAGTEVFWVYANATQYWWGTGEEGTDPGENEEPAARLAQLLAGWNVYCPAVEWLLRRLSLRQVRYRGSYYADGAQGRTFEVDLGAGGHLAPVEETMGVTELHGDSPGHGDGEG